METRVLEIERSILELVDEIKKDIPAMHRLSFEWSDYRKGLHGFYHIASGCNSYYSVTDISKLVYDAQKRRINKEILFRKFT